MRRPTYACGQKRRGNHSIHSGAPQQANCQLNEGFVAAIRGVPTTQSIYVGVKSLRVIRVAQCFLLFHLGQLLANCSSIFANHRGCAEPWAVPFGYSVFGANLGVGLTETSQRELKCSASPSRAMVNWGLPSRTTLGIEADGCCQEWSVRTFRDVRRPSISCLAPACVG